MVSYSFVQLFFSGTTLFQTVLNNIDTPFVQCQSTTSDNVYIWNNNIYLFLLQRPQNDTYRLMLDEILNTPFFYFSYDYDISHSLQRFHSLPTEYHQLGLAERANQQFVWNGFLLKDLITTELKRFCLPIVHGCEYILS